MQLSMRWIKNVDRLGSHRIRGLFRAVFFMIQEIVISCIIKTLREDATRAEPKVHLCAFDYFNLKGRIGQ